MVYLENRVGAVFPSRSPCFSLRGCLARKDSLSSALRQGTHGKDSCLVEKTAAPVFHTLFPSETHFFSLMPDFPQNRPLFPSGPHSSSRQIPHARFPSESPSFSLRRLSCPRDTLTSAPTSSRHSVHPSASPHTRDKSRQKDKRQQERQKEKDITTRDKRLKDKKTRDKKTRG